MFNKNIISNVVKVGIKSWLKSICKNIDINALKLSINKKRFSKLDKIYLEAENLIYQDIYINKIIIKIYNCNLKFNYRNHIIYSEDLKLNCILMIDKENLKNTFYSKKWQSLRIKIERSFTKSQSILNLFIYDNLIFLNYTLNKLNKEIILSLRTKDNLIFLEDINNKKKILLPIDKNIKFNSCQIKNEQLNIELSSSVIFDN